MAGSITMLSDSQADFATEALLRDAALGDDAALARLLNHHRERLHRMIAFRLDPRLAVHVDASDIVQEALADAARKLTDYCHKRPLPFYPWLHRLASERLALARRRYRRVPVNAQWADSSANQLIDLLVAQDSTPSHDLAREEQRRRVHAALDRLAASDREILILRYLEELAFAEIAAILGIEAGAAKMRHLRALQRIRMLLEVEGSASAP